MISSNNNKYRRNELMNDFRKTLKEFFEHPTTTAVGGGQLFCNPDTDMWEYMWSRQAINEELHNKLISEWKDVDYEICHISPIVINKYNFIKSSKNKVNQLIDKLESEITTKYQQQEENY